MTRNVTAINDAFASRPRARRVLGVMPGEGIGPEVVAAALVVLEALPERLTGPIEVRRGGLGMAGVAAGADGCLTEEVATFHRGIFEVGGAVLSGPAGGRFVYDLRRRFDLFCKLVPLRGRPELADESPFPPDRIDGIDILLVRENTGGFYQGAWLLSGEAGQRRAQQRGVYTEEGVARIVSVAARLAARRRGELTVVVKSGGLPAQSRLWREVASEMAAEAGIDCRSLDIDLAAYELVRRPRELDVIVAPNLFGDVLSDLAAILTGGRGSSFSGNFGTQGEAVYQTNHGAAHDIAGQDVANPAGQILSLAMLLRESFASPEAAERVEAAVNAVWRAGWRTADLAGGDRVVGTREMARRIADVVAGSSP